MKTKVPKFKIGDRVIAISDGVGYNKGQTGTINQDNNDCPWVIWDDNGKERAATQNRLELLPKAPIQINYQIY